MATVLTIGGVVVDPVRYNLRLSLSLRFEAYSSLTIERRGGTLPASPDPYLGKTVTLSVGGVTVFAGDVQDRDVPFTGLGWSPVYACTDLKFRADRVPFTDANTGTDAAAYNLSPEDPASIVGRQGRNAGQILADALTGSAFATALSARGIGNYVTLSPVPILPTATLTDLSAMTWVPPRGVYIGGERGHCAISQFCRQWAPNHMVWIDPATGAWRFLDKRLFTDHTLTMGTNPITPTPLSRRLSECFQRVTIRGQPVAEPKLVSLANGGLAEDFAWGSYATSADAKAAWAPVIATQDLMAKDSGTCTVPSTLTVNIAASDDTARHWIANYWDQTVTGTHGVIQLFYSPGAGINMYVSRRIISNTALTAGGTCTLTLDQALPATNYTKYLIYGVTSGAGFVYEKYKVVDTAIAAAMARQFTYPQPFVGANGDIATLTSFPVASVCWSSSGSPPYQEWPIGITIDPSSGHIYTLQPTFIMAGGHDPSDVRALIAVNTGALTATRPTSGYEGTSNTVDGLQETLTLTVGQWRDPINQTAMEAFAQEMLDSVKDSIIEGSVTYLGLYGTALSPGHSLSIAGNGYATEWSAAKLAILAADLTWNPGNGQRWNTVMHCSNRRAALSSEAFLKPDRMAANALATLEGGMGPGNIMAQRALMADPNYRAAMEQQRAAQAQSEAVNRAGYRAAADAIDRRTAGPGDQGTGGDDGGMDFDPMDDGRTGVNRPRRPASPRGNEADERVGRGLTRTIKENKARDARVEALRARREQQETDRDEGLDDDSIAAVERQNAAQKRGRRRPVDRAASERRRSAQRRVTQPPPVEESEPTRDADTAWETTDE